MISQFICRSFPGLLAGLQSLSVSAHAGRPVPSVPQCQGFSGAGQPEKPLHAKDPRQAGMVSTQSITPLATRFVLTSHPCSLLDLRRLQRHTPALRNEEQEQPEPGNARQHLAALRARFDDLLIGDDSVKPTPDEEAATAARSLSHLAGGFYQRIAQAGPEAVAGLERPESWAARDFDRSGLGFGDMTRGFACQTARMCDKYLALIRERDGPVWDRVRALLSRAGQQAEQLMTLGAQLRNGALDRRRFIEALDDLAGAAQDDSLLGIETRLRETLAVLPDDPFTQTFETFRLSGAVGQIRLDGGELLAEAAPGDTIDTVLAELACLHRLYPDTASVVIANFQEARQVERLQARLREAGLGQLAIVPLIEDEAAVAWFAAKGAKALHALGVRRVMLAGSDLPREAGLATASIRTAQFTQALQAAGFEEFYFGSGCTPGRSGWGQSPALAKEWALPFQAFARTQFTVQGAQHQVLFGSDKVAADSLRTIRQAMAHDQAPVQAEHIEEAEQACAFLIERDRWQRAPDSEFGRFFLRHRERLLAVRNAMAVCGSRDKTLNAKDYASLYQDRAINVDFMQRFFRMVDGFAWTDLDAQSLAPHVARIRQALDAGNPLVHQIMLKLALMSIDMLAAPDCLRIWEAAGFSAEDIDKLERARRNRLHFLKACGYSLKDHPELRRMAAELLGVPTDGEDCPVDDVQAIMRQVASSARQAAKALARAVPERRQIAMGLSLAPYKSFSTGIRRA